MELIRVTTTNGMALQLRHTMQKVRSVSFPARVSLTIANICLTLEHDIQVCALDSVRLSLLNQYGKRQEDGNFKWNSPNSAQMLMEKYGEVAQEDITLSLPRLPQQFLEIIAKHEDTLKVEIFTPEDCEALMLVMEQ